MIFFAVFPFTALFSMTMVKDSLFMPFFIWFAMIFVEAVRTQGVLLKQPQFFTAFLLTALLMGLTKKNWRLHRAYMLYYLIFRSISDYS